MPTEYKTPGVYVEEIPKYPPSIYSVYTFVSAFIGYIQKATAKRTGDLLYKPMRIQSFTEYERYFRKPEPEGVSLSVEFINGEATGKIDAESRSIFLMHYSLQMFFANGGSTCWII